MTILELNDTSEEPSEGLNVMGVGLTFNAVPVKIPTFAFLSSSITTGAYGAHVSSLKR